MAVKAPEQLEPVVHSIFEPRTSTWQYIVADPQTHTAAIIDSVLDFHSATNKISTESADELLAIVAAEGYTVNAILETHLHADHITAATYLRAQLQDRQSTAPQIGIGGGIAEMQHLLGVRYGVPASECAEAFDRTFADGDTIPLGTLAVEVMHLPGHTPDHVGYRIGSNVFAGDSIFNPDLGSARVDFPRGSAAALWASMQRLLRLPAHYRLYTGHDYPPADRVVAQGGSGALRAFATVQEHVVQNKHAKKGIDEADFVAMRTSRDASLGEPALLHQALQFNIRAGRLPTRNGARDFLLHAVLKVEPDNVLVRL